MKRVDHFKIGAYEFHRSSPDSPIAGSWTQYLDSSLSMSVRGDRLLCDAYAALLAELAAAQAELARMNAERNALQEELTKLMATANHNAALSIAELRESMRLPKDEPVQGRCANCGEWHPIADMWAECTACFDETVARQAIAELADVRRVEEWKSSGVLRALSSPSHDGLQMWSAYEWRDGSTSATVVASADSLAALGRALEGRV